MRMTSRILVTVSTTLALLFGSISSVHALNPNPMHDGGGSPTDVPVATGEPTLVRDDLESSQWYLDAIGARGLADDAGKGVTVAVLSDGVWAGHPDLSGRVLDGWNMATKKAVPANAVREPGDTGSTLGTFAAGLIAGSPDKAGVRGIAPGASILPVVVETTGDSGDAQVAAGIDWATANGADLIVFIGGLSAALISEKEDQTCRAITAARGAGIATFVAAGNDYDSSNIEPKFFAARCADAVAVGPLSATLGEANGFRNVTAPAFSAPAVRITSALAAIDWLPYTTDDQAEWAPVIAAGAAAVLRGTGLSSDESVTRLAATATDLSPAGSDAFSGAGLIDLAAAVGTRERRDAVQALDTVNRASTPRIQAVSFDEATTTGITWEPPVGTSVDSYRIDITRWDGTTWVTRSFTEVGNAVRTVVAAGMDAFTHVAVVAITATGERRSLPTNTYTLDPFKPAANPYAKVTAVDARWVKEGVEVSVTTNSEGVGATWYLSLLDGWTLEPLRQIEVNGTAKYVVRFTTDDERRVLPLYVTATINGEKVSKGLLPQYLITATGLSAGKSYAAVTGTTDFACMESIAISSGCEGAEIRVVDTRTGKVLGRSWVMADKTFTVVFPWKSNMLRVHVEVTDPDHVVRSATIIRPLSTRN